MKRSLGKKLALWVVTAALAAAGTMTVLAATERLDTVSDLYWDEEDDTVAMWEEVDEAYQYEVYLYLDDSRVTSIKTKKTKYDFEKKLTKGGEYTFRVRALAKSNDKDYRDGAWSEYSDGLYISDDYAELIKNGGKIDTVNSGPGAKGEAETSAAAADSSVVYKAEWIQDEGGWWYRRTDGTYPVNCWFQDPANGKWFFFNASGYMVTGWVDWNGQKYYCDANANPAGAMVTGEHTIDGIVCVFDESGVLVNGADLPAELFASQAIVSETQAAETAAQTEETAAQAEETSAQEETEAQAQAAETEEQAEETDADILTDNSSDDE